MTTLRSYLLGMAVLLALLFCLATAVVVRQLDAYRREQNEHQLLDTTRALSLLVDSQLGGYEATLRALRESRAVADGEWSVVDRQARGLLPDPDDWIIVQERSGRVLVDTGLPSGRAALGEAPPPANWASLDQDRSDVCDLARAPGQPPLACVELPIMRDGRAAYRLAVVFRPALLKRVLDRQEMGARRFASIIDRNGVIVWRNVSPERFVGGPATSHLIAAMRRGREGVVPSVSLEGVPTVAAFSRSSSSGWTFVVGVPRRQMELGDERAIRFGLAAAVVFVVLGSAIAIAAGRRLTSAMRRLSTAALRIRAGEPPAFRPSGIREIDAVGAVLDEAITARDASQERFNLAQEVGGIGSWEWDMVRNEGRVSDAYKEMHGVAHIPGLLRIEQVKAVIHPDDLPGYEARLKAGLRRPEATTNEYRVIRPDGSIRWVAAKGRPLLGPNGRAIGGIGVVMDLTERKAIEERLRLLMREVDHRANNLMAVIQGIVSLSRAADGAQLREIILGRVEALARTHQLLAESRWKGADLMRLAQEEMLPFTLGDAGRVRLSGPDLVLAPAAAQALAMVLHELATNAAKHGALSVPEGRVAIGWSVQGGAVRLRWEETGGPPVVPPQKKGFGTTVLQRAFSGSLHGKTRLDWRAEGLVCELEVPLESATANEIAPVV